MPECVRDKPVTEDTDNEDFDSISPEDSSFSETSDEYEREFVILINSDVGSYQKQGKEFLERVGDQVKGGIEK